MIELKDLNEKRFISCLEKCLPDYIMSDIMTSSDVIVDVSYSFRYKSYTLQFVSSKFKSSDIYRNPENLIMDIVQSCLAVYECTKVPASIVSLFNVREFLKNAIRTIYMNFIYEVYTTTTHYKSLNPAFIVYPYLRPDTPSDVIDSFGLYFEVKDSYYNLSNLNDFSIEKEIKMSVNNLYIDILSEDITCNFKSSYFALLDSLIQHLTFSFESEIFTNTRLFSFSYNFLTGTIDSNQVIDSCLTKALLSAWSAYFVLSEKDYYFEK